MTDNKPTLDPRQRVGVIADVARNARLIWRLFRDRRVPWWTKAVPLLALGYVIFPLDFIPDALLGLGQLDDLTIVLLGLKAFINLSPGTIVAQYRDRLRREETGAMEEAVDTSYRVLDDERKDNTRDTRRL